MKFKIIAGELPQSTAFNMVFAFPPYPRLIWNWGKDKYDLQHGTLKTVELLDDEKKKSLAGAGTGALVGAVLAGPAGLLAGALLAGNKRVLIAQCELLDGRTFVAEIDMEVYKLLLAAKQGVMGP